MALAQQLAELAVANSQGLLNDDEYRLLRQNLFEQHSNSTLVPTEVSLLPVAHPRKPSGSSSSPVPRRSRAGEASSETRAPLTRPKTSVVASVANLLRRATGRKTPVLPTNQDRTHDPTPTDDSKKRKVLPRILHRKASELFSTRTEDSWSVHSATTPLRSPPLSKEPSHIWHATKSPSRPSPTRSMIPTFPSATIDIPSSVSDVLDDGNLHTAKDIRAAIIATETEAQRLLEAFDGLESTTSLRVYQRNARRLPSATPTHANVLIDGREWRDHRPLPLPKSPDQKTRRIPATIEVGDGASVRSGSSSIKTSLSQSKSISSLRNKQHPSSPLSTRFPSSSLSIKRKNSVSSISSQAASTRSRLGLGGSLSRSTGHLPLSMLPESDGMQSTDTIGLGSAGESQPPEVSEIHRRREDVMARYLARLEYLRAKLKGAELHEKLRRR